MLEFYSVDYPDLFYYFSCWYAVADACIPVTTFRVKYIRTDLWKVVTGLLNSGTPIHCAQASSGALRRVMHSNGFIHCEHARCGTQCWVLHPTVFFRSVDPSSGSHHQSALVLGADWCSALLFMISMISCLVFSFHVRMMGACSAHAQTPTLHTLHTAFAFSFHMYSCLWC